MNGLRKSSATFSENLTALKNLNLTIEESDFILFHSLIQKLDIATTKRLELQECSTQNPSYRVLSQLLENSFSASPRVKASPGDDPYQKGSIFLSQSNSPNKFACSYCNSNHAKQQSSPNLAQSGKKISKNKCWPNSHTLLLVFLIFLTSTEFSHFLYMIRELLIGSENLIGTSCANLAEFSI